jgi:hypothetical protein
MVEIMKAFFGAAAPPRQGFVLSQPGGIVQWTIGVEYGWIGLCDTFL